MQSCRIRKESLDELPCPTGPSVFITGCDHQMPGNRPELASGNISYRHHVKRIVDFICAFAGLVVSAPVIFVVAVLVRVVMGSPVLFRQARPGLRGQSFTCFKFRTMVDTRDAQGSLLSDRQRLGPLGNWLRHTSLDELPQLWNILTGDLSFVGPRPLLEEYLPYYTQEENRRHSIRPGLTGWAQIHGRNHLDFDERLKMDVWYVDNLSWRLDMLILLATIKLVFTAHGTDLVTYLPLHEQRREELPWQRSGDQADEPQEQTIAILESPRQA